MMEVEKKHEKENLGANVSLQEEWEDEVVRVEGERECRVAQILLEWREHMAKIMDVPPQHILSFEHVVRIANIRPSSVLEL